MLRKTIVDSPMGPLWLFAEPDALVALEIPGHRTAIDADTDDDHPVFAATKRWLDAYFAKRALPPMPRLAPRGTEFQQGVWRAMLAIPSGQTLTYGSIAKSLKRPNGSRAVGLACGRNPIPIIIPCHRVIGSNGSLTGFGWGLPRKVWLLTHEGLRPSGGRLAQTGALDLEPAPARAAAQLAR